MRTARVKVDGAAYYHVMNRVLERRRILKGEVAEKFRLLMRRMEAFSGVEVVTYCIMSNHVHLLLRVPDRKVLSDSELLAKVEQVSSKTAFAQFMDRWNRMVEQKSESGLDELRQSVLARMFDLSVFMKELKQRFSIWYNRKHDRKGTLWEERFKSSLIENKPGYLGTAAAYIDLNPVRAGMVQDPKDYRFCGYAEALAGDTAALAGLHTLLDAFGPQKDEADTLSKYRLLLFGKGVKRKDKPGFSPEKVDEVFEEQGKLTPVTLVGHRLRWFSDGMVIGSKAFVQDVRTHWREKLGLKRTTGAYESEEDSEFCMLRPLRGG
jgi:REP element-mobilizing transposase RayT